MRKKIISMLLASTMILSMALTGCGNNESGTADTVDGTQTTSAAAEGDLTDIKMAYMIFNTAAPDMGLVQDEINKISEKEIGVHVTIEPIAVGDYATQVNLMFASGEELDIVQALTTNFTAWYANGSLTPIDSELETYGQGVLLMQWVEICWRPVRLMVSSMVSQLTVIWQKAMALHSAQIC